MLKKVIQVAPEKKVTKQIGCLLLALDCIMLFSKFKGSHMGWNGAEWSCCDIAFGEDSLLPRGG